MAKHAKERAFYDMSGADNIYKYITTEGKIYGEEAKKFTMLEYLQKSTGVFNQNGMLTKEQVKEMKRRAQTGEKNLWHGFISFNKENSEQIDDPEKCIALINQTFGQFFKDAGFNPDNMDLMCALHLDRPEHLHIHYVFWEKEPKVKNQRAAGFKYRAKGKIPLEVIDKMTERLNAYTIVLKKVREIQKETYKRNPRRKYKTNDKNLKRKLAISSRKVRRIMDGLFGSVAELFSLETTNYRNRLREIEEEMQEEYEKENCPREQVKPISSNCDLSK